MKCVRLSPELEETRQRAAEDYSARFAHNFEKERLSIERSLDVNEIISRDTSPYSATRAVRYNISVRTELAAGLPQIDWRSRAVATGRDESDRQQHRSHEGRRWKCERWSSSRSELKNQQILVIHQRHRCGISVATGRTDIRPVLHDQGPRHWDGAPHKPVNY